MSLLTRGLGEGTFVTRGLGSGEFVFIVVKGEVDASNALDGSLTDTLVLVGDTTITSSALQGTAADDLLEQVRIILDGDHVFVSDTPAYGLIVSAVPMKLVTVSDALHQAVSGTQTALGINRISDTERPDTGESDGLSGSLDIVDT